jgi:hypothetical protein
MEKSLIDILKNEDYRGFKEFLRSDNIAKVLENEEMEFFKTAPEHWQKAYLKVMWVRPQAEKCLMISGTQDVLKWSYKEWGFWRENVLWAFFTASPSTALKVLKCFDEYPGADAELAMIRRNDLNLLKAWLEKYHSLSEDSERYLEEHREAQTLKSEYVNYTLTRQAQQQL